MNEKLFGHFHDFCKYELLTGGPDPHMAAVVEMSKDKPDHEKIWRAMLYVGFYNVPSAEAVWRNIPPSAAFIHNIVGLQSWLDENWKKLRTRRERRTVNSPTKMSHYLLNYADMCDTLPKLKTAPFEKVWEFAKDQHHVGRYAATKLCEIWWRMGLVTAECPDIRAKGGWSPREAMKLIHPEDVKFDSKDDCSIAVREAEEAATKNYELILQTGIKISRFEHEVLACEFKESLKTHRQYPGRSLDSELKYSREVDSHWGVVETDHMRVRSLISPAWALGERQGWDGVREELGFVLANYGYTWSDSLYDWHKSKENLKNPVRNEHGTETFQSA